MLGELDLEAIAAARVRIAPHVTRTPLLRCAPREGCELLLKPESLQATGAFKLRGAFSLMTTLPRGCPGVVAHSSGNHAQAVARAARVLGRAPAASCRCLPTTIRWSQRVRAPRRSS
jgi:threonine dehydratase